MPDMTLAPQDDQTERDIHVKRAAEHLYHSVRPEGGLSWRDLTQRQRQFYVDHIETARALTNRAEVQR